MGIRTKELCKPHYYNSFLTYFIFLLFFFLTVISDYIFIYFHIQEPNITIPGPGRYKTIIEINKNGKYLISKYKDT